MTTMNCDLCHKTRATILQPKEGHFVKTVSDDELRPRTILCEEITRIQPSFYNLGIGFSVSHAHREWKGGRSKKPPYFSCRYNIGDMGNVNIVAFYYPLLGDWELMEKEAEGYRRRIRSAIREEMIHAVQIITIKEKYDQSLWAQCRYNTAQDFYEDLLGKIIDELTTTREGQRAVLTAAQLYYEDWTITSMEKLRETDRKLHGQDGYLATELIRQLVQINFGELTSEEAKGNAWDKHRIFNVGDLGTTEVLLRSMAKTLREAVPQLVRLSPTLAEALSEIEGAIRRIDETRLSQLRAYYRPDKAYT
jgi:hypothetical protein